MQVQAILFRLRFITFADVLAFADIGLYEKHLLAIANKLLYQPETVHLLYRNY